MEGVVLRGAEPPAHPPLRPLNLYVPRQPEVSAEGSQCLQGPAPRSCARVSSTQLSTCPASPFHEHASALFSHLKPPPTPFS